jgi:hypothetical protein
MKSNSRVAAVLLLIVSALEATFKLHDRFAPRAGGVPTGARRVITGR